MGDQARETRTHAEESILFGHHDRVLEFDGCNLFAGGVDVVGNTQLRQGPAAAGDGNGTRSLAGEISGDSRGDGVSGSVMTVEIKRMLHGAGTQSRARTSGKLKCRVLSAEC